MKSAGRLFSILLILEVSAGGCVSGQAEHSIRTSTPGPEFGLKDARVNLAGSWEYAEGGIVYPLILDDKGNGTYAWKEGLFITTSFENGVWRGTWRQKENDREGGFEVILSENHTQGDGRWWYTRIGDDRAPREPGGTFVLMRADSNDFTDPFD